MRDNGIKKPSPSEWKTSSKKISKPQDFTPKIKKADGYVDLIKMAFHLGRALAALHGNPSGIAVLLDINKNNDGNKSNENSSNTKSKDDNNLKFERLYKSHCGSGGKLCI